MTRFRFAILVAFLLCGPLFAPWAQPATAATPGLTLPASGTPGSKITYAVTGFPANATVTIKWNGEKIGSVAVNGSGARSGSFTMPRAPKGTHRVRFVSGSAGITRSIEVVPGITLSVKSAKPGDTFKMRARGFQPNTLVTAGYLSCCGIMEEQDRGTTSSSGSIDLDLNIPSTWNPNDRSIFVATIQLGTSRLFVDLPVVSTGGTIKLTLDSTNVKPGRKLGYTITSSFPNTRVSLLFNTSEIGTVRTNGSGGAAGQFTVPQASRSRIHSVSAQVGSVRSSVTVYIVLTMKIAPDPAAPGETVTITGSGFSVGESVRACFWLGGGCNNLGTKQAGANGSVTFKWTIFPNWGPRPSVYVYLYYGTNSYMYWILGIDTAFNAGDTVEPTITATPVVPPTVEAVPSETPPAPETPEPTAAPEETSTPEPTPEPTMAPTEVVSPEPTPPADIESPSGPPEASPESTPAA